jgi:outer membrane lipoprotein LolB
MSGTGSATKTVKKKGGVPAGWEASKAQREKISQWELRGRLSVQTQHDGGVMDLVWRQFDDVYSIHLIAPLGAGSYMIEGNADYAVIRYPDGERQTVEDIDSVFEKVLEVKLPVSALKDWVRGLPAHKLPVDKIVWNDKGLINRLYQSGWNVEMTRYTGGHLLMPHAIYLGHLKQSDIDVRLILNQWLIDN